MENKITTGIRLDNGEQVTGELFTWDKYGKVAIICEPTHERISQGHPVNPFTLTRPFSRLINEKK